MSKKEIISSDKFFQRIHQVEVDYVNHWKEHTLWHWEFWLSVALSIIPWLDFLGLVFGLWHYSGRVLPTIPAFLPWDFTLIPVTLMLWLQFKPTLNPFFKAVIYSSLTSFISEPVFEWIGFYTTVKWSVFYSFPIYIIIYLIADRISKAKSFDTL
ncbi:CBO0543 family protein [Neobacillus sp. PS3-34]|uniref:CBO0543 family protein n=1 Tax=Neobacillus sp. PS3-34 TaxID=3070678 RepID=UPI0035A5B740